MRCRSRHHSANARDGFLAGVNGLIAATVLLGACASGVACTRQAADAPGSTTARALYMQRCFWCHGEDGGGDGPSAAGMVPRPRDFRAARYGIRSTAGGRLPTDDDLFRVIERGMPGTPMQAWGEVLSAAEIRSVVSYIKEFSPRFGTEAADPLPPPPRQAASPARGADVYRKARCALCHGSSGRGDGAITTTLAFEWGEPFLARDLTRGWAFKGGSQPSDIYLRITGGLNGTPMGPYQDLLGPEERWDLAHYVASLNEEPSATSDSFLVAAKFTSRLPVEPDDPEWAVAGAAAVPLAPQIVHEPAARWWTATAATCEVRAFWSTEDVAFLLEWNDPTGPTAAWPDSASLQFPMQPGSKPYFLYGEPDGPVLIWRWQAGDGVEVATGRGAGALEVSRGRLRARSRWSEGRWQVLLRAPRADLPGASPGEFLPILVAVGDGANAEGEDARALSTWLYTTLVRPRSARAPLLALAWALGVLIIELLTVSRLRR